MAERIEKSLLELDFASLTRRTFTPSPAAWEDHVLYFLLVDRFSDDGITDEWGRRRLVQRKSVESIDRLALLHQEVLADVVAIARRGTFGTGRVASPSMIVEWFASCYVKEVGVFGNQFARFDLR